MSQLMELIGSAIDAYRNTDNFIAKIFQPLFNRKDVTQGQSLNQIYTWFEFFVLALQDCLPNKD